MRISIAALSLGFSLSACTGGGSSGPVPHPTGLGPSNIDHIVIVFQENRSPDNLFHGLPGADTTVSGGLNSHGQRVPLKPVDLENTWDLGHSHGSFSTEYDGGKMDGFDLDGTTMCSIGCPPPEIRAYSYVPQSQVQPYFTMAEQYTFADRMFQTNEGPSFPAHQYIISGTSLASPQTSLLAAENPSDNDRLPAGGCDSPADALVALIDQNGNESRRVYPCFDHSTVMDLLDAKGISWRYYQPQPPHSAGLWTLDAIAHIVDGPDVANISAPSTNILSDIGNGTLAHVSWVIPTAAESDHPDGGNLGPSWVASIVNAIGNSPYWNHTAIIVTWDDWGGWYDHVPPASIRNSYELGFRVPMIVVSPYAKPAYVSHVQYEFGSILKFVESTFGLPSLGYTDAVSNDLGDCFNFNQTPLTFQTIQSKYKKDFFMRRPVDLRPIDEE